MVACTVTTNRSYDSSLQASKSLITAAVPAISTGNDLALYGVSSPDYGAGTGMHIPAIFADVQ